MNGIPERHRGAPVPDDAIYMLRKVDGHLGINLAEAIPADTALEHELVKGAARAWRRGERNRTPGLGGIVAVPAAWGWQQLHRPSVAAIAGGGAASAVTAFALAVGHPRTREVEPRPYGSPPRVVRMGPPKGTPGPAQTTAPPDGEPLPAPSRERPTGPPVSLPTLPSVPPIGQPSMTVTVTEVPPGADRTCRIVLPHLLSPGLLCSSM